MLKTYSRLSKIEDRKNLRRALIYLALTIVSLSLFIIFGIPLLAKFAAFLTGIRLSNEPVEKNDIAPPIVPWFNPLPETVNQTNLELNGKTEPGATVILYLNNKKEEVLADKDGVFSYNFSLDADTNTISAIARDGAGNESQKTEVIKVIHDNSPPKLEIIQPTDGSKYYGAKQRQVVIEGVTEEETTVQINGRLVVVESDGTFAFATTLTEGENKFTCSAEDKAGNKSEASLILFFTP